MNFLAIVASAIVLFLISVIAPAQASNSCTERYNSCVQICMRDGIGASRRSGVSRPMPADVCQAHCIGWATECKSTGCFNGDLRQECGLIKR
jgi:hypothetical protein